MLITRELAFISHAQFIDDNKYQAACYFVAHEWHYVIKTNTSTKV